MPIMIPTPEEIAAMPWHERQRVQRIVRQLLISLNVHGDTTPRGRREAESKAELLAWARDVRREARRLERLNRIELAAAPDPDAEEHVRVLLEAIA